jgi:preprotein translocase subunit SecE
VYAFFQELFKTGIYKRNQGRIARQVTFFVIVVVVVAGVFRMSQILPGQLGRILADHQALGLAYGLSCMVLFIGIWAGYRTVNVPIFADFLIAVEAEMRKVSWPSWAELYRGSIVVLVTIFALAAVLFLFDFLWKIIFTALGTLPNMK